MSSSINGCCPYLKRQDDCMRECPEGGKGGLQFGWNPARGNQSPTLMRVQSVFSFLQLPMMCIVTIFIFSGDCGENIQRISKGTDAVPAIGLFPLFGSHSKTLKPLWLRVEWEKNWVQSTMVSPFRENNILQQCLILIRAATRKGEINQDELRPNLHLNNLLWNWGKEKHDIKRRNRIKRGGRQS